MTQDEKRQANQAKLLLSISAQVDREENNFPQKELNKSLARLKRNASSLYTSAEIDNALEKERTKRFEARRAEVLAKRPEQEAANPLGARTGRATMKDGGKFPDLTGDDKVTQADILKGRGVFQEGGDVNTQMEMMLGKEETPMLPDEEMEEDYVDYVVEETLSNEDRNYLIDALEKDDRLSEIFDQVVESATEFTGSGTVEGPGTGRSDSIPARLSDGEFVITAKATEEIGADNLMSMMKDAEAAADERQQMANGGEMEEEETIYKAQPEPQTQDIRVTKATVGREAMIKEEEDLVGDELKKSMLSTRPYVRS